MSRRTVKPNRHQGLAPESTKQTHLKEKGQSETHRRIDAVQSQSEEAHSRENSIQELLDQLPADRPESAVSLSASTAMESQAFSLARELESRRRDLELREARLNRHLLLLDQERQSARLTFSEQEHSLQSRIAVLARREKEVADQLQRAAIAEEALKHEVTSAREHLDAQARIIERDRELLQREQERLRAQSSSLDVAERRQKEARAMERAEIDSARQLLHAERLKFDANCQKMLATLNDKQAALDASVHKLSNERREISSADRAALEADRAAMRRAETEYQRLSKELESELQAAAKQRASHDEDCRNERRRLLLERETMQADLQRERAELTRRKTALEDAQAALQKTQVELTQQQQAILEERLAVEQVMQSLGRQNTNGVNESLAIARRKLADHYRWMKESLHAQRVELREIARQLDAREHLLAEDRDGLQQWVENQQQELDSQLVQLEAQRQQIQRREADLSERELRWAMQKKGLEARLAIAQSRAA